MLRISRGGIGIWVRLFLHIIFGFLSALIVAIVVSLILSGEMPWLTSGWQHEVSKTLGMLTFLAALVLFLVSERRKRRN